MQEFKAYTNGRPNSHTMHSHWARLIEVLHCAELIKGLLNDENILDTVERPPVTGGLKASASSKHRAAR